PPACRARRSRAPALRGNRGSGRCPRRSACRCAFFAPWKSARGFLPLFHLVFRSVPLPFSRVLRYNLSWTKYSLLRLWILALPFYLIGLALSAFLFLTPTFIIEPKFLLPLLAVIVFAYFGDEKTGKGFYDGRRKFNIIF